MRTHNMMSFFNTVRAKRMKWWGAWDGLVNLPVDVPKLFLLFLQLSISFHGRLLHVGYLGRVTSTNHEMLQ